MALYRYLVISKEQYDEFSEFLTSCFALENLLFLVQAITFRHIISEMIGENNINENIESSQSTDIENNAGLEMTDLEKAKEKSSGNKKQTTEDKVFAMKFNYLEGLIEEKPTDTKSIHEIVTNMYDEYISIDAEYQVNIPAEQRNKFTEFLKNDHEAQDYLNLFDEAIMEVYGMLTNVYRFQFKADSRYIVN